MKKLAIFIIVLLCILLWWPRHLHERSSRPSSMSMNTPPLTSMPSERLSTKENGAAAEMEKRYREQIVNLSKKINQYGLDANRLNHMAITMGRDSFLAVLPKEVRKEYVNLHAIIEEMQEMHLKMDGMERADLRNKRLEKPLWIKKREEELRLISLPAHLQQFINEKTNSGHITDDDVRFLIEECNKEMERSDCIQKAVSQWIQNRHLPTEKQNEIIKSYL